ncbi:MAG TPA: creatininase family protein [Candidatus Latescibacteria bacterium]|nr:creatininase family protein [Candidatus Latescibacterota bacterium]
MRWERITASDLAELRKEGVALIPIGSLEKHGEHLPLGIDSLMAHKTALLAAEREPAVVLPPLFFTYTKEMKNLPGAISLEADLLLRLLEAICDEVARNGFHKIILVNGHGGNTALLKVFLQQLCDRGKDYAVYLPPIFLAPEVVDRLKETEETGHACEVETSFALYLYPELVHMDRVPEEFYTSRKDYDVSPATTSVDWYASYPDGYVGDAKKASVEKGRAMVEAHVVQLVDLIRKVKRDGKVPAKVQEFSRGAQNP